MGESQELVLQNLNHRRIEKPRICQIHVLWDYKVCVVIYIATSMFGSSMGRFERQVPWGPFHPK